MIFSLIANLEFLLEDNDELSSIVHKRIEEFEIELKEKDYSKYKQYNYSVSGQNNVVITDNQGIINLVQFGQITDEYQNIRNELNKLIAIELSLKNLLELRETSGLIVKNKAYSQIAKTLVYGFPIQISNQIEVNKNEYQKYKFDTLDIINGIEEQEKNLIILQRKGEELRSENSINTKEQNNKINNPDLNTAENIESTKKCKSNEQNSVLDEIQNKGDEFKKSLLTVSREIDKRKHHLKSILLQVSASINDTSIFMKNMVDRIKHIEFKDQADIHQKASMNLSERLTTIFNPDELIDDENYILQTIGAIGIMIDLEKRRIAIERLIHLDKSKRQLTIWTVIGYILLVISSLLLFSSYLKPYLPSNEIFISVLLWSIFGSVASMVLKFNQNPINNFGDAVKWLITRPTQGVVFGAAIYLVIVAGQFVFSGNVEQNGIIQKNSEIILLIAFLVGFSDKFAINVFNSLIEKYTGNNKNSQNQNDSDLKEN